MESEGTLAGGRVGPTPTRPAFVRPARHGDEDLLRALRRQALVAIEAARGGGAYAEQHAAETPMLGDERSDEEAERRVWLGGREDAELGYLIASILRLSSGATVGVVEAIFVVDAARGCGIGELLLAVASDWFRSRRCVRVDAATLPGERATKNFFEEHGLKARLLIVSRSLDVSGGA